MSLTEQARRLDQPVSTVMSDVFITLSETATLCEAAKTLRDRRIGLLLITSGDELVGVISERDIVACVANGDSPGDVRLADRGRGDIITIPATATLQQGVSLMAKRGIRHLVVVGDRNAQPVGVLSARDVLSELAQV